MYNSTLWASWVIKGQELSIFHSGDSGYSDHFKAIGERLGPIDMTFIKIGDYGLDLGWQDIHMIPERSIDAHIDVQGQVLFPIHWGTFQLSNHDWDEPIKELCLLQSLLASVWSHRCWVRRSLQVSLFKLPTGGPI